MSGIEASINQISILVQVTNFKLKIPLKNDAEHEIYAKPTQLAEARFYMGSQSTTAYRAQIDWLKKFSINR